jgi:hypothetical protein
MSDNNVIQTPVVESVKGTPAPASLAVRSGLFVLFLVCSLAVFLLGPKHYQLFPTNGNIFYVGSISAIFLITALLLKRSRKLTQY